MMIVMRKEKTKIDVVDTRYFVVISRFPFHDVFSQFVPVESIFGVLLSGQSPK